MALYSRAMDLGLAIPTPIHAQIDRARRAAAPPPGAPSIEDAVSSLVTTHERPYAGGIPAAARTLERQAQAAGFETVLRESDVGCVLEGLHRGRRVGFRAYWLRGKTDGATWHSGGRDRYKLVDISSRPIGVDAKTKLTKARHRHDENDRTRLVLVESPRGVGLNVTELKKRISE